MADKEAYVQGSGTALLAAVARASPGDYLIPAIDALNTYIDARTRPLLDPFARKVASDFASMAATDHAALSALTRLASLRSTNGWPPELHMVTGHMPLAGIYITGMTVDDLPLPGVTVARCVLSNVTFRNANFESEIAIVVGPDVTFQGCNFDKSNVRFLTLKQEDWPFNPRSLRLKFVDGSFKDALFCGLPAERWIVSP